jgi:predicted methyltransferase
MRIIWIMCLALALPACAQTPSAQLAEVAEAADPTAADSARLAAVLESQPAEVQARYSHRHPQETLELFGIAPGMTVVEVLPGGGWYTKVLLPYLGSGGHLIGADYAFEMVAKLGFLKGEALEARRSWADTWSADAESWRTPDSAAVSAYTLGTLPEALDGSVDAVLFIRALHNLARVEAEGGYLTAALANAHRVLKPGGIVGVVQHEARPDMSGDWAGGANGYLKRAFVIAQLEGAGFEYVEASEVNANPKDRPGEDDRVWRLPPSLSTSRDDAALRERLEAVGESNRMTLKFRKPE